MSEQIAEDGTDSYRLIRDSPSILDQVQYVYVSYAQVSVNSMDFRIALGDRIPPNGKVNPVVGLTMSHDLARALLTVLSENVPKIDSLWDRMQVPGTPEEDESGKA